MRADSPEHPFPSQPSAPNWPVPAAPPIPSAPDVRMPFVVERLTTPLDEALLGRRIVTVSGMLDSERVTETAARLLHLDALATDPVTIRLDSPGGDAGAALVLVDTLGQMRADVRLVVVGQAVGAAVVVVAAADEATIYPHARIVLAEPDVPPVQGDATHVDAEVTEQRRLLDAAYDVIARRCHRSRDDVARDARQRTMLTAEDAVRYGLVARVEQPRERQEP